MRLDEDADFGPVEPEPPDDRESLWRTECQLEEGREIQRLSAERRARNRVVRIERRCCEGHEVWAEREAWSAYCVDCGRRVPLGEWAIEVAEAAE